jgi:hypothetical protein
MNHDEHPNDSALTRELRDSLSEVAAPERPPLVAPADIVTVINPAAMPSGTKLFFGYFNSDHALVVDLIYTSSYTCSNGQPPATP